MPLMGQSLRPSLVWAIPFHPLPGRGLPTGQRVPARTRWDSAALRDLVAIEYDNLLFDHAYLSRAPISGLAAASGTRCQIASQFGFAKLYTDSSAFSKFGRQLPAELEKPTVVYPAFSRRMGMG
jgi:hypothetical protein